jgi:protein involved in polysaccharide export with SLBB domain
MYRLFHSALVAVAIFLCGSIFVYAQADSNLESDPESRTLYTLRAGDRVQVNVYNEPDLSVVQKLDPNGILVIPLLGRTELSGLTLRDAETYLEKLFIEEEFLISPQVTVSIADYAEQVFYVFGEVNNPGAKILPEGKQSLDILEAITMAGDLAQYAKRSEITIRRPVEGPQREMRIVVDLDKMIRGSKDGLDDLVIIYPDDIIYVPERLF